MTNKQNVYLDMSQATYQVMTDNRTKWENMPRIVSITESVNETIVRIGNLKRKQETDNKGITRMKSEKLLKMAKLSYGICRPLTSFARSTDNPVLEEEINFSMSDLSDGKANDLVERCRLVHDRALEYIDELADYSITDEKLNTQLSAIDAGSNVIPLPRTARSHHKTITTTLLTEFSLLRIELELLDGLMETFSDTHNEFYLDYLNARKEVNRTGRKIKLIVHTTDAETEAALRATVNIEQLDIAEKANRNGNIRFTGVESGRFTLRAVLNSYVPEIVQDVQITPDGITRITIRLRKAA